MAHAGPWRGGGYSQRPGWDQWWDVGPNMEAYMWQAQAGPDWYDQQWSQWHQQAPPGLGPQETPDPVALSLLKHLQQDVPGPLGATVSDKPQDQEADEVLAGQIESAVASFLAGGDLEDSDEEEPRGEISKAAETERPEAQLSAEAGVFVPMSGDMNGKGASKVNLGPKCDYLISTLERVGLQMAPVDMPTEKHVDNFLEYMRSRQLPPQLSENEELCQFFHQEIHTTIASSYKNRICPTQPEVERSFSERSGNPELKSGLILTMCALKTPERYHILPPDGKGRQPVIFLAETPSDFTSFLDPERNNGEEVMDADWDAFDKACRDSGFRLPQDLRTAAIQMREQVGYFQQTPLAQVQHLLHFAIGKAKLAAWDDAWRPKHVVDDLNSKQQERIAGMTARLKAERDDKSRARWQSNRRYSRPDDGWKQPWGKQEDSPWGWQELQPHSEFDAEKTQWPSLAETAPAPRSEWPGWSGWSERPKAPTLSWQDETSSLSSTSYARASVAGDFEAVPEDLASKLVQIMIPFPSGIPLSQLKKEAAAVDLDLWRWERDFETGELVALDLKGGPEEKLLVTTFQ